MNLVDSVKSLFGNDMITRASSMLDESESGIQKAVSGIVPAVLAGILNKAGSGDAAGLLSSAKDAGSTGILSGVSSFFGSSNLLSKGADMLGRIFGQHSPDVANAISSYSGIKPASATSLLSVAAPAALGMIGKQASEKNMNTSGLLAFLNGQKDNILNAVPSGLNLAGALGLSSLGSIGSKLSGALSSLSGGVKDPPGNWKYEKHKTGGTNWVLPLIIVLAVIGLLWYLLSGKKDTTVNEANLVTEDTQTISTAPVAETTAPVVQTIKVRLPDGVELNAYPGGIEDQLVNFLNDPSKNPDKNLWFDFDHLNFETGSAVITQESMPQLQNISSILKAFPKVAIKIGGYTDKTGDSVANQKLSLARAEAVVAALKDKGSGSSQLQGAEGYGSQFATMPAEASDEDRKKDRRIAVSVRKK